MNRPEEISNIIKSQIKNYKSKIDMTEICKVILVGDGIARVYGLRNCMANELLEFEDGSYYDLTTDIGVMIRTRPRRGDVNGDGYINTADAVLVLRHTVGMGTLTGDAALQADTNFDEGIDVRDAAQILRFENSLTTIIQ